MKKVFKIGCFSVLGLIIVFIVIGIIVGPQLEEGTDESVVKQTTAPTKQTPVERKEPRETRNKEVSHFLKMAAKVEHSVRAFDLIKEYEANEFAADAKYKGKIAMVRGKISNMHTTLGMHFLDLESVNFIVSVSCKMKKSELPKLQKLAKEQDVLVIGKVTGSTAGLSVDLEDCLVMTIADYQKIQNQ